MAAAWSIGHIAVVAPTMDPGWRCAAVAELFSAHPDLEMLPVLDREQILGIVYRLDFYNRYLMGYGRELYGSRPITVLMDPTPLVADADAAIDDLSLWIADHRPALFHRGLVVSRQGRYLGVVSGLDLVRATAGQLGEAVTELKRTQQNLIESEKLASLGGLIAGISHEINTPVGIALMAITTFAQDLQTFTATMSAGKIRRADLDAFVASAAAATRFIELNLARTRQLIGSFRNVAVDQVSEQRRWFAVRPYLGEILLSLQPQLRKTAHRVTIDGADDLQVESYPGALAQIVTNLVMNAVLHAFPAPERDGCIQLVVERAGAEHWMLTVADDGVGMESNILAHAFEPFFTTRRGQGSTGLGLSITHHLVCQRLGGEIAARSQPGDGSCFTLRMPVIAPLPKTA